MANVVELTERGQGQPKEWMAGRDDSIRGVVLAGIYPWANSVFDRMLARPLVPVAHKPLISYALSWLAEAGIARVTVCGNRQTRALHSLARHIVSEMVYSYVEDSMPRGAAGCVRDAADGDEKSGTYVVTDGAAVPNGVDLRLLLGRHQESGADATVVVCSEPGSRGTAGALLPAGIYVVNRAALECVPRRGFFDIKEHLIPKLYSSGARVLSYEIREVVPRVLNAQTYLAVNAMAIESIVSGDAVPSGYNRRGEALIHADARIAADAILAGPLLIGQGAAVHSGAVVIGPTSIGCDVVINDGALVSRSAVWRRSVVQAGATADLCILGDGAVIQTDRPELGRPSGRPQSLPLRGRGQIGTA
jgi:NDP-sugar pyrophosphorylase family protein